MKYPEPVQQLFDAFDRAGRDLYLVGGAVRDYQLGAPFNSLDDLDFCTDARPPETAQILRNAGITVYELGAEFGTVGAVLYAPERPTGPDAAGHPPGHYPKDCQITTYRSEEYYRRGSRHPVVEFGDTIEQDLGRRDFSINSMALDKNGALFDPYAGKKDLDAGILRVIGDPLETLAEDPLRILRIGRFISKLGFEPTPSLREAADQRADGILDISAERWLQEMGKLLRGPHVGAALLFLHQIRILGMILPEVDALYDFSPSDGPQTPSGAPNEVPGTLWQHTIRALQAAPRVDPSADTRLGWALLLQHIGKRWSAKYAEDGTVSFPGHQKVAAHAAGEIGARFRFDNETTRLVKFLLRESGEELEYHPDWSDAMVRRYVRRMNGDEAAMLNFARANLIAAAPAASPPTQALSRIDELDARIRQLAAENRLLPSLPSGLGNHLIKHLGLKPSPLIGELKSWLEDEIIEERIESGCDSLYYVEYIRRTTPDFLKDAMNPDKAQK